MEQYRPTIVPNSTMLCRETSLQKPSRDVLHDDEGQIRPYEVGLPPVNTLWHIFPAARYILFAEYLASQRQEL